MDEKQRLSQGLPLLQTQPRSPPPVSPFGRFRRFLIAVLAVLLLSRGLFDISTQYIARQVPTSRLVPLEAHIISKCPDTRDALRLLILPVMQRVHDKVDFQLSYIGTPAADQGVDCMHGPSECMGNIIELCARKMYPDPKINLGFIMCLTKDYEHIPERALIEDCALEHAIDIRAINECATRDDGAYGMDLLRTSIERSAQVSWSRFPPLPHGVLRAQKG
ncbi:uncharacterized protein UV8b_06786 [Ustilaginoidea virens]|uniref:Gamma interferon inducible lysosomal thiol reductase n=1 Tax=Ustilaginoidea virens TaxID=1159556 RepID=A0A8E5HW85_USTVR|nr:uncharacterized protein UV8b_06786 [Ustilaginoidea virens]QUC22545.1 hypothetical protein UV8b_06786 [Ustilaginoidea virens]